MAEVGSIATPGSTAESGTPAKASAAKDRTCPYCRTSFTSSSLGRHLDLFIKDKNPKPPDGVHDIEEIRKTRGNITRRQARTSSARREGSQCSSTKPTTSHDKRSPSFSRHYTNGDHPPGVSLRAGWEATGVINDIPPTTRDTRYDIRREQPRKVPTKNDMVQRKRALEERDRGRAAELALREVLDSIQAAKASAHPKHPFEFDFFTCSFPALCLRCLPCPSMISSSELVPSRLSWPISPPGPETLELVRERVAVSLKRWHKIQHGHAEVGLNGSTTSLTSHTSPANAKVEGEIYYEHLTKAYVIWANLSEAQKKETWHIEALRAFAREQKAHYETRLSLHTMEQEATNLRIQVNRLNECQQPREYLLFPPNQLPISKETASLIAANSEDLSFDLDKLLDKWKEKIRTDRSAQRPLPAVQRVDTPGSTDQRNGLPSYLQQNLNGDGDMHAHQGLSEDDLIDAPGDEDDEIAGQVRAPTASMDRRMLDPKLRDGGDEVMQGIEGDGEGYVGGRLLAELREYGSVNGSGLSRSAI